MRPRSLSASAIKNFEACPALWLASSHHKTPEVSGSAANLGSSVHNALERFVKEELHSDPRTTMEELEDIYEEEYRELFEDNERYDEGLQMLVDWFERTHPITHEVLSVEVKESFPIPAPDDSDPIPFNYIWDRCDRLPNGDIEVVDYKTSVMPVNPDDLRNHIQARTYSLAARIKYPQVDRIWVSLDMLRYDKVGVAFKKSDDAETWKYLKNVLDRIWREDEDNPTETLNPNCRWCIRAHNCDTLMEHAKAGGPLSISDPEEAANKRAKLDYAKTALENMIDELDEFLAEHMEKNQLTEGFSTDETVVSFYTRRRRNLDSRRAAKILGPDVMEERGNLRMSDFDELMDSDELTEDQKRELKGLVSYKYSNPSIKTEPTASIE